MSLIVAISCKQTPQTWSENKEDAKGEMRTSRRHNNAKEVNEISYACWASWAPPKFFSELNYSYTPSLTAQCTLAHRANWKKSKKKNRRMSVGVAELNLFKVLRRYVTQCSLPWRDILSKSCEAKLSQWWLWKVWWWCDNNANDCFDDEINDRYDYRRWRRRRRWQHKRNKDLLIVTCKMTLTLCFRIADTVALLTT